VVLKALEDNQAIMRGFDDRLLNLKQVTDA